MSLVIQKYKEAQGEIMKIMKEKAEGEVMVFQFLGEKIDTNKKITVY